ncbi:MAG: hypothetical protein A2Z31_05605 [candidate division NC10 bacterium RBG_16_65_8]|nr:MAG: hypothetical protein A2Z31_05605 [candidate division NC10 bacterium RBG_16_65_8]
MVCRFVHSCCSLRAANVLGGFRRVKEKARRLGLLLVAVALGACAQTPLVPEAPGVAGPILQEVPGLRVAVEAEAWKHRPSGLGDTVLPLLVALKNTGTGPVTVARQDFALLDQANRQYLPIPPGDVAAMFGGGSGSGVGISPSVGIAGSSGGRSVFGGGLGVTFGSWGSDARDIIPLALADGPIQPGAEVRGFLYFPRPAPDSQGVRLVAVLRDLPGTPQLEFRFRRAE